MASCFGALLNLCSWECLFQSGFMLYSECLELRSFEVLPPLVNDSYCVLYQFFLPAGSCSGYFIATLSFTRAGTEKCRVRAKKFCKAHSHPEENVHESFIEVIAKLRVSSSSLTSQPVLGYVRIDCSPLVKSHTVDKFIQKSLDLGEKLLGSLGFALKHLSDI